MSILGKISIGYRELKKSAEQSTWEAYIIVHRTGDNLMRSFGLDSPANFSRRGITMDPTPVVDEGLRPFIEEYARSNGASLERVQRGSQIGYRVRGVSSDFNIDDFLDR
jgi:hypothetical protein